jgi:hypothetical protein
MVADRKLLEFLCPLCQSNLALATYVTGRNGKPFYLPFYRCAGCSVVFSDIDRFTRLMRHTYDVKEHRVEEKPTLGPDERPLPYWSPAAQLKKP